MDGQNLESVCSRLKSGHVTFRISPRSLCTIKDLTNPADANDPRPRRLIKASFQDYMKEGAKFYEFIFDVRHSRVRMVFDTANVETIISNLLDRKIPPVDDVVCFIRGARQCWFEHENKKWAKEVVTPFFAVIVNGAPIDSVALLLRGREFL